MPCPVTSPSTTASRPSGERHVVVEVAADVDARRGLRRPRRRRGLRPPGEPAAAASAASRRRNPSAAGRGARCRWRAPPAPAIATRGRDRRLVDRVVGTHARAASATRAPPRSSRSGRSRQSSPSRGTARAVRATRPARAPSQRRSRSARRCGRDAGCARPPNACGRKSIERTAASRRSSATCSASGSSCSRRGSGMRITAASTSRSSTTVRDDRFERHVEREALRERARDLVERPEPARGLPLGRERLLQLGSETRGLLVQPRVLDRDRERRGDRREQLELAGTRLHAPGRIDGEQADHLVAHHERQRESRSRFPLPRARRSRRRGGAPSTCRRSTTTPRARYGPSASSSSASAARRCGPARPRAAPVVSPLSSQQVDREPLGADELPELLGRSLERVLERELLIRLSDDGEERARLRELCLDAARPAGSLRARVRRASRSG